MVALHVIQLPEYLSGDVLSRLQEELNSRGKSALYAVQEAAKETGVSVAGRILETTGSVVSAICDFAQAEEAEMIIMGTKGTGGVARLLLGSVAEGVARSARCPVLVVR